MKKISVYGTNGPESVTRYRIWQYYTNLKGVQLLGHTKFSPWLTKKFGPIGHQNLLIKAYAWINMCLRLFCFLIWDLFRRPEVIVIQRELVKHYTPFIINLLFVLNVKLGSRVIWDFDDHILAMGEINHRDFLILAKYSTSITVTHDFLKSLVPEEYSNKVILLPTTDGEMYEIYEDNQADITNNRIKALSKELRVVWVATKGNLKYLETIAPVLDKTAELLKKKGLDLKLLVICNGRLEYDASYLKVINIEWSKENALNGLLSSHVGIMPLDDNDITKGKGSFKLVQYMSVGLPCISSNVGFNKEVITEKFGFLANNEREWIDALFKVTKLDTWSTYSKEAYVHWQQNFSYTKNLSIIQSLI